jgi:DNA-binding NarL/FixJ family response regulator
MIRIAIADDKINSRTMLANKIGRSNFFTITLQASNGEDFLNKMKGLNKDSLPHIVLMDLEMPVTDGVTAIASASSLYPDVKYVVLTTFDDDDKIFRAIKAGACGYLLKEESGDVIVDMLMNLWQGGAGPISPSIAYKILQIVQQQSLTTVNGDGNPADLFQLSAREKEILHLLSMGDGYKEIGHKINISANTVKKHTVNIYQKLHVNTRAQALRIAYTKGLI